MEPIEEKVIEQLKMTAGEGSAIRLMCQSDGFKIFRKHFENKIEKARESWLTETDPQKSESLKRQAILWTEIVKELKKFMLMGDNALRTLEQEKENLSEASNTNV